MKKNILTIILIGLITTLICAIAIKKTIEKSNIQLPEGFIEVNLQEREIFKDQKTETTIKVNTAQNITISLTQDGKIKITLPDEEIEKIIPEEKAISLMSDGSCAQTPRSSIFVLTDNFNVYKTSVLYDEEKSEFIPESFKGNFEKIYDGTNLNENDKVELIQLSVNQTFTTCGIQDVFLKINNNVIDFKGQSYTKQYPTRNFMIGDFNIFAYNFDGTMKIKKEEKMLKLKNNEGKEIKALLFGQLETSKYYDYMLDEEGNEYHFSEDLYNVAYKNNGILNITKKNKILKIGKKDFNKEKNGYEYEIIFENKERKYITVANGNSTFQEIGN